MKFKKSPIGTHYFYSTFLNGIISKSFYVNKFLATLGEEKKYQKAANNASTKFCEMQMGDYRYSLHRFPALYIMETSDESLNDEMIVKILQMKLQKNEEINITILGSNTLDFMEKHWKEWCESIEKDIFYLSESNTKELIDFSSADCWEKILESNKEFIGKFNEYKNLIKYNFNLLKPENGCFMTTSRMIVYSINMYEGESFILDCLLDGRVINLYSTIPELDEESFNMNYDEEVFEQHFSLFSFVMAYQRIKSYISGFSTVVKKNGLMEILDNRDRMLSMVDIPLNCY